MTRRVLLTGAAGFLGAHTLRYLLGATDWTFVCPVTFRHRGTPERLIWAVGEPFGEHWGRVHVTRHDLATPVNPATAALFGDVDLILNFASDTHPPRSVEQPVPFVENNVGLALHLLEYARTLPRLHAFVQVSTDSVYGPAAEGTEHFEWDPIIPNNPYTASKAAQEALAIAYWRSYGVPTVIAATMNPTGVTQDTEKFIPMTIKKLLAGDPILIHTNAIGEPSRRTYIHGRDVANAVHYISTHLPVHMHPDHDRPSRWNIVGHHELGADDVLRLVADTLGVVPDVKYQTVDRPEHGHRYAMSGRKLGLAGWLPLPDIEKVIVEMTLWSKENPLWLS